MKFYCISAGPIGGLNSEVLLYFLCACVETIFIRDLQTLWKSQHLVFLSCSMGVLILQ